MSNEKKLNKIQARIKKLKKRVSKGKKSAKEQLHQAEKDRTVFLLAN